MFIHSPSKTLNDKTLGSDSGMGSSSSSSSSSPSKTLNDKTLGSDSGMGSSSSSSSFKNIK